ncbi:MAG: T9SS type A sorting domain-containing protein [Bacteroidetes bacterium]|nr:T9SS type A sorting domain-containing protein [Bacteroidota bacterium]
MNTRGIVRHAATLIFGSLLLAGSAFAQDSVNVHFIVNTAAIPDTINKNALVSLRGGSAYYGDWSLTTKNAMSQISGDYWGLTIKMKKGDVTGTFKPVTVTNSGTGWDMSDRNIGPAPSQDSTVMLFANGANTYPGNDPLNPGNKGDSVAVLFRVNVGSVADFDAALDHILVAGEAVQLGPWGATKTELVQESNHKDGPTYKGTKFFSKVVLLPKSKVGITIPYKFIIKRGGTIRTWEEGIIDNKDGNRYFTLKGDTTLMWKYFGDKKEISNIATANITFQVDVTGIETLGLFRRDQDTLTVPGQFNTWNSSGTVGNIMEADPFNPYIYSYTRSFTEEPGTVISYKTYIKNTGIFPRTNMGWLESGFRGGANYTFKFTGTDTELPLEYAYDAHPDGIIPAGSTVNLTVNVDMRDEIKKTAAPFVIGVDTVFINGPDPIYSFIQNRNGNTLFNTGETGIQKKLFLSDDNNDSIYTLTFPVVGPARNGFIYGYAYQGKDEGNNGYDSPNRYRVRYIKNNGVGNWPSNYTFPTDKFGKEYFIKEDSPEGIYVGVDENGNKATAFELNQNYPNPFNPATTVPFSLPSAGKATFDVFNILGQKVMTQNFVANAAGKYSVSFNGQNMASGIYLVKMSFGDMNKTIKMMLVK